MSDWSEEKINQLRLLWSEGHSTAEIGRQMKVTKHAAAKKAKRLGLPGRPSPIHKANPDRSRLPSRAPKNTLPVLPSLTQSDDI